MQNYIISPSLHIVNKMLWSIVFSPDESVDMWMGVREENANVKGVVIFTIDTASASAVFPQD